MALAYMIAKTLGWLGGLLFLAILVGGAVEDWIRERRRARRRGLS